VPAVEFNQSAQLLSLFQHFSQSFDNEYPLDKILSKRLIMKPSFVFDGQQGEMFHEDPGKEADPGFVGHSFFVEDLHSLHSAAGRIAFKNKPAKVL
jgi:hypothetical protein